MRLTPEAAFLGLETLRPMVVAGLEMQAHMCLLFLDWPAQIDPHHFEINLERDPAEMEQVLHFTCTSGLMQVRMRLHAPAATSANGRAGGCTLPVRARLTAQAAACSATVDNVSGQCGSGRGTGAPSSSKSCNTAA
ncbi:MAG: hypothetical protein HYZ20_12120 [Burkholderiales bacterium]|nr:hypothetical protein [Burkholderiales bacterium]